MQKKKKPKFNVPNLGFFGSVKARWRKPRGTHNKKRIGFQWTGASPKVGYKNPESIRGLHSSGKREVLVNNTKELEGLKDVLVRIAGGVGAKKRKVIAEKAKALNLRLLNMPDGATKIRFAAKPAGRRGASA
ncbi:MAG: eL32 family ribosomal protein [Candidatus ainarchaeum sp.]|nr:eL32 family ribosomal protein [Candidatus ainarchaeum sp.]